MDRTKADLLEGIVREPHDAARRLVYADWLEENGDPQQAGFIRTRCALDRCIPDADDYPTLVERCLESAGSEPRFSLPPGFTVGRWWDSAGEKWWSDPRDCLEGGLLSFVSAEADDSAPAGLLVERLADLVRTTPVRGIEIHHRLTDRMAALLASPAARQLERLCFESWPEQGRASAQLRALAGSPVPRTLSRLEFRGGSFGFMTDAEAVLLSEAPFDRLERLDLMFTNFSLPVMEGLMSAPWFRRLRRLAIGFNARCALACARRLAGMPDLHSLCVWMAPDPVLLGLGSTGEFPELRRLFILCANLKGNQIAALARMNAPKLVDLWLRNSKAGKGDFQALAASPLFSGLRVLTFDGLGLNLAGLDAVAASACASKLRILRFQHAAIRSLARSALARPGAFPSLTSLVIDSPFDRGVRAPDAGALLEKLDTPHLRHLSLSYCAFDDACAAALATNPSFGGLTRLVIRHTAGQEPKPKSLAKMLRSENMKNLVVLELWDGPTGDAAKVLSDGSVMPRLAMCVLNDAPTKSVEGLKKLRPLVRWQAC